MPSKTKVKYSTRISKSVKGPEVVALPEGKRDSPDEKRQETIPGLQCLCSVALIQHTWLRKHSGL